MFRSVAHATWLRDACQCTKCVHPSTKQKLFRSSDILGAAIASKVRSDNGWKVTWSDGHSSFYPNTFLDCYASPGRLANFHHHIPVQTWSPNTLRTMPSLFVTYSSLSTTQNLAAATEQIAKYGILFITGVPNANTSDEDCELRILAEKFGQIRSTFYGMVWDVISVRDSKNIAYTNLHLDLHMDLLYFHHPPRYQILHCLRNKVSGGTSAFVDAFHISDIIRKQSPSFFGALATTPVPFQYINDGHHLYHTHPTIELAPLQDSTPLLERTIKHVNYSPPFQAPFSMSDKLDLLYTSLRKFADLLDAKENRYEYTLQEGDAVLFDNRRVLHARTAFKEIPGLQMNEGDASRWLKGCYLDDDSMLDHYRVRMTRLNNEESGNEADYS